MLLLLFFLPIFSNPTTIKIEEKLIALNETIINFQLVEKNLKSMKTFQVVGLLVVGTTGTCTYELPVLMLPPALVPGSVCVC
jgi:hypothetical protein